MLASEVALAAAALFCGYDLIPDALGRRAPDALRRGRRDLPAVALTFDDGPHPELTPRVLAELERAGVRATFFVVGANARRHPELVHAALAAGHAVGVHTETHRHAWLCTPRVLHRELRLGLQAVLEAAGRRPLWFRPPYGAFNAVTRSAAAALGLRIALWSCDAGDWLPGASVEGITRRVLSGLRPGAVIDLHDGGRTPRGCRHMVRALPAILSAMRARGLRGVHLGELTGLPAMLAADGPVGGRGRGAGSAGTPAGGP